MEDLKATGHRVQPGFSGGTIWDEDLEGVVGMVVAADDAATKVAYMIPAKVLLTFCPELDQQSIKARTSARTRATAVHVSKFGEGTQQQVVGDRRTG